MVSTKTCFGAWGAVAVCRLGQAQAGPGPECENVFVTSADFGACEATGMTVDSDGWIWFTTAPPCHQVWMCSPQNVCNSLSGGDWTSPSGIAVDDSRTIYVSDKASVKKCTFIGDTELKCVYFGEHWASPRGLALDRDGNIFVTNAGPSNPARQKPRGLFKCDPTGWCQLLETEASSRQATGVTTNSTGDFFVTGVYKSTDGTSNIGFIDECTPHCASYDMPYGVLSGQVGLAVSPDQFLYIRDDFRFIRCSPLHDMCEDIPACHGGGFPSQFMVIRNETELYSVTSQPTPGGGSQLVLRRFRFSMDNLQI